MQIPFFYLRHYDPVQTEIVLDEDTSRHVITVLRMKKGEQINLTDGNGNLLTAEIINDHKKKSEVRINASRFIPHASRQITIAISLIKNSSRFEWFLEKATEIGVSTIQPVICERTEKQKFRFDRMQDILVSAMLQSQQAWLPELMPPVPFRQVAEQSNHDQKFIAHCLAQEKRKLADLVNENLSSQLILIGPEGDFTIEEVQLAMKNHFTGISLGDSRLRSETAGVVAATILKLL